MTINEYKATLQGKRIHDLQEAHTKKGETILVYMRGNYCYEVRFDTNGEQLQEVKMHIWDVFK